MAPTPRTILLLTLVWTVPAALSDAPQHIQVASPTSGTSNHSEVRLRQMRSAGDEDSWFSRLSRGDSQEVPPPFWANRGRRDMADLLQTVLKDPPERDARGGKGSEELPPFWANRGRRQEKYPVETLKALLASSGGVGGQTSAMDVLESKMRGQNAKHGFPIPLRYLDEMRGNNTGMNGLHFVDDVLSDMLLDRVYRQGASIEDVGPFWANRGRRNDDENEGKFWANRGRREGEEFVPFYANRGRREGEEFVPFYANRGRREGEDFVPFYANRGRREGDDFVPFYANRGRREGEEFVPFYANRGRREGEELGPFYANRGRREGEEFVPFYANRGRREGEELGPFWANRGRREEERTGPIVLPRQNLEQLQNYPDGVGPFWANRGRRDGYEGGPFWANRGRREDGDDGPFWANRGRSAKATPTHKQKRMRRQDPLYVDEPQWVVIERREKSTPVNLERSGDDPFWIARGKRDEEPMRENRGLKESLSNEDEPFWPTRGRRDLRDSLSIEEPFWALRGRRGLLDSLSKEDPFWATRGRRGHAAELSREVPVWTLRGKKADDKEMVGRGRRFSSGTSATRALGVAQDPNFWPVRGKRTHDPGNEEDNRFWDTLERKYQNKIRIGNATNQTNKVPSLTD